MQDIDINAWAAKAAAPLRWALVVGIAYTLASTAMFFASPTPVASAASASAAPPAAASSPAAAAASADLGAILEAGLFGHAPEDREVEAALQPTARTRLPLTLQGVFVAEPASDSAAIIARKGQAGRLYAIGDELPGNATLRAVQAEQVILLRAGQHETLTFPEAKPFRRVRVPAPQTRAETRPPAPGAAPRDEPPPESAEEWVERYRERLNDDPQGLLEELAVAPVSVGESAGYRVGSLTNLPYLTQTGLLAGDLILSVNGRPVGDVEADRSSINSLLAAGSVRIEVQRGERRFFVTTSLPDPRG
ncbi:MAG: hypothetical protein OXF68_16000 [Gammaproteobacteria bacterium]|nr:hypothetical protein [Gammaproteobacteria bacterium]